MEQLQQFQKNRKLSRRVIIIIDIVLVVTFILGIVFVGLWLGGVFNTATTTQRPTTTSKPAITESTVITDFFGTVDQTPIALNVAFLVIVSLTFGVQYKFNTRTMRTVAAILGLSTLGVGIAMLAHPTEPALYKTIAGVYILGVVVKFGVRAWREKAAKQLLEENKGKDEAWLRAVTGTSTSSLVEELEGGLLPLDNSILDNSILDNSEEAEEGGGPPPIPPRAIDAVKSRLRTLASSAEAEVKEVLKAAENQATRASEEISMIENASEEELLDIARKLQETEKKNTENTEKIERER